VGRILKGLTKADKGNITVALDKTFYIKIKDILQDTHTYSKVTKNPINKMVSSLKVLLTRWKKSEYISLITYRTIYCSDGILPRAYLPKVHKLNCPFRIIILSIDSPVYSLATFTWTHYMESLLEAQAFPKPKAISTIALNWSNY